MEQKTEASQEVDELLPCPFCGTDDVRVYLNASSDRMADWDHHAECSSCAATGPHHTDEAGAAAIWNSRAALKAQPAPTEAQGESPFKFKPWSKEAKMVEGWAAAEKAREAAQGEDSARLDWSSEQAPNSECCYQHVTAQTPFGRILITWKGWKDDPSPTVDEHPVDGYFYVGDDVADAKENAERAYFEAINRARASAETGGVKP